MTPPAVSVVVPTYNRADLLRRTLESLAQQQFPGGQVEVVVADDGSSDATREVAHCVADRLPTRYYHQEDRGFRAGAARNGGAKLASAPVLVFLDTGVLVGPGFARAHAEAHQASGAGPGRAVLGHVYGYDPDDPYPGLDQLLAQRPPAEVVAELAGDPTFQDVRHGELAAAGFDLGRLHAPWALCFSVNLSVRADDFWAVGGFDEDFTGYGFEDVELGYRLARHGVRFAASRDAWGVELPHERDHESNLLPWRRNLDRLLAKHRGPVVELYAAICTYYVPVPVEHAWTELTQWAEQARGMDVRAELAEAVAGGTGGADLAGPDLRVAGIGCGGAVPESWPGECALVDFDRDLLDQAAATHPRARLVHGVGVRTPFPDESFDLVVISSRLAGLWERWGEVLLVEAHRLGRQVRVPLLLL